MSHSGFGAKTDPPPNRAFHTDFGTGEGGTRVSACKMEPQRGIILNPIKMDMAG